MTTTALTDRRLGRRGPITSALGMGTWAIGGPWQSNGRPAGWGEVDDAESTRAIHAALDGGVRLFDTANCYGAGHSERVVGAALHGRDALIATKFGNVTDEQTRTSIGQDVTPDGIRAQCEDSLRRLGRDVIDIYQLHDGASTAADAEPIVAVLEELVTAGKVRWFGTSVDRREVMRA